MQAKARIPSPASTGGPRRAQARRRTSPTRSERATRSNRPARRIQPRAYSLVDGRARGIAEPLPSRSRSRAEYRRASAISERSRPETRSHREPPPRTAAVLVNIVQQPTANTVDIARGIDELFRDRPGLVPQDVRWSNFYDQAAFVSGSVRGARDAILIGVGLAVLVLYFFLRDWRLTAIAAATIPVTVAIVLLGLSVFGQTINLMTLGGIAAAIGLVADDAIVVVEDIHRSSLSSKNGFPMISRCGAGFRRSSGRVCRWCHLPPFRAGDGHHRRFLPPSR